LAAVGGAPELHRVSRRRDVDRVVGTDRHGRLTATVLGTDHVERGPYPAPASRGDGVIRDRDHEADQGCDDKGGNGSRTHGNSSSLGDDRRGRDTPCSASQTPSQQFRPHLGEPPRCLSTISPGNKACFRLWRLRKAAGGWRSSGSATDLVFL